MAAGLTAMVRCRPRKDQGGENKQKALAQFFRKKNKEPESVGFLLIGLLRLLCT
jgi:hypothetical protein